VGLRIRSTYATVPAMRRLVGIEDSTPDETKDDDRLWDALVDISDLIDAQKDGHFFVWHGSKDLSATESGRVWVPDLISVSAVASDDGSRTWGTPWASGDWHLYPPNAPTKSPPWPYSQLRTTAHGAQSFPTTYADGVRITGEWGHYRVLRSLTTLSAEVGDGAATTIVVPVGMLERGHTVLIDAEQLLVTEVQPGGTNPTDEVTVARAMNGTEAAAHDAAAPVAVFTYPLIEQACLLQAHRSYRRADTPFGTKLDATGGGMIWVRELDPDVRERVNMLRVPTSGGGF
jgi:hypothetical protein